MGNGEDVVVVNETLPEAHDGQWGGHSTVCYQSSMLASVDFIKTWRHSAFNSPQCRFGGHPVSQNRGDVMWRRWKPMKRDMGGYPGE